MKLNELSVGSWWWVPFNLKDSDRSVRSDLVSMLSGILHSLGQDVLPKIIKRSAAIAFRRTRLALEFFGMSMPPWLLDRANAMKAAAGITAPPPAKPRVSLTVRLPLSERALDAVYMRSLRPSAPLPASDKIHLMVDVRVAQVYRERGIPRYAQALVLELAKSRPDVRFTWLIEPGEMPFSATILGQYGEFVELSDIEALPRVTHYLQACLFDRGREAKTLFPSALAVHKPQLGTICYDLIPWIFPELYLLDDGVARGYLRAAELLPTLDRIFAISSCSRADAIAFGCDPDRVATIYGGWTADRLSVPRTKPPDLPARYWLYIGGDDPRKNLRGLFTAFAHIRRAMPDAPTLVVVCALTPQRRSQLMREASEVGLDADRLLLTGYVSDGAMGAVIEGAVATIFPSLYEGLGLPVLESYAHGRAALVSDNSSLVELAPRSCRFDAALPESIAEAVLRFHHDPAIEAESLAAAPSILATYQWPRAAACLSDWLDETLHGDMRDAPWKPPLNVISTLPPDQSGVALYTQRTFASAPWPVEFFLPGEADRVPFAEDALRHLRHQQRSMTPIPKISPLSAYRPNDKPAIWVLGNSEHHLDTIDALARKGQCHDFLYLHEAKLEQALALYHERFAEAPALPDDVETLSDFLAHVLPRNILVNSVFAADLIGALPTAANCRIEILFLPVLDFAVAREPCRVKPADEPLVVVHIGILGASKQPDKLVAACELIARKLPVKVIFAGYDVANYLRICELEHPWIETREGLTDSELIDLMVRADVGVQPRWPQHGESSGAVCQWIGLRKPVITTNGGSFSEFAEAAWLVAPEAEPDLLAETILQAAQRGPPPGLDSFLAARTLSAWHEAFSQSTESAVASLFP